MQNKIIYTLLFLLLLLTFPLNTSDVFATATAPPSAKNGELDSTTLGSFNV